MEVGQTLWTLWAKLSFCFQHQCEVLFINSYSITEKENIVFIYQNDDVMIILSLQLLNIFREAVVVDDVVREISLFIHVVNVTVLDILCKEQGTFLSHL